jgi:hypothetical protein
VLSNGRYNFPNGEVYGEGVERQRGKL